MFIKKFIQLIKLLNHREKNIIQMGCQAGKSTKTTLEPNKEKENPK